MELKREPKYKHLQQVYFPVETTVDGVKLSGVGEATVQGIEIETRMECYTSLWEFIYTLTLPDRKTKKFYETQLRPVTT